LLHCSKTTANHIKRLGIIDDAITQIGRKIVVDADQALKLLNRNENNDEMEMKNGKGGRPLKKQGKKEQIVQFWVTRGQSQFCGVY